jgi:photosystem II stability/assembly factor-like uncharacterized protein
MKHLLTFFLVVLCLAPCYAQTLWQAQTSGVLANLNSIKAVDDNVVWVSGDSTILRTVNGGTTWAKRPFPLSGFTVYNIEALDSSTAWAAITGASGLDFRIMKTTDGGSTWVQQFQAAKSFGDAIRFYDAQNGIAYGDPDPGYFVVVTTTNGGTTWVRTDSIHIPKPATGEFGINNSMGILGNGAWFGTANASTPFNPRIFRSTDRGLTWAASSPLTGLQNGWTNNIVFKDSLNGTLVTGIGKGARTTDRGITWTVFTVDVDAALGGVQYVPGSDAIIVVGTIFGTGYAAKSFDQGTTWMPISVPPSTPGLNLVAFSSKMVGWATGLNGTILKWVGMGPLINISVDAAADSATADGSQAHPFKSVDIACQNAQSGASITVAPGTYGKVYIAAPRATNLTISSSGGAAVTIVDMTKQGNANGIAFRGMHGWVVDGFTFKNLSLGGYSSGVYLDSRAGDTSALSIVRNCIFLGDLTPGSQARGIWVQKATKVLIHHNYFINVNYNGVISYGNVNFFNNTVVRTKNTQSLVPTAGFWQAGDGGSNGVAYVKNNIFYDCDLGAGRNGDCFIYSSNNLYHLNAADTSGVTADGGSNVFADPMFVATVIGAEDLRLGAGSPAINKGANVGLPYVGSAPEIGAYEGLGVTSVANEHQLPREFALKQNYPNPFNPGTTIYFELPRSSYVSLKVYTTLGQEVSTLVNESKPAGVYSVHFDASALASGVYLYRIQTAGFVQTKKMLLMK